MWLFLKVLYITVNPVLLLKRASFLSCLVHGIYVGNPVSTENLHRNCVPTKYVQEKYIGRSKSHYLFYFHIFYYILESVIVVLKLVWNLSITITLFWSPLSNPSICCWYEMIWFGDFTVIDSLPFILVNFLVMTTSKFLLSLHIFIIIQICLATSILDFPP